MMNCRSLSLLRSFTLTVLCWLLTGISALAQSGQKPASVLDSAALEAQKEYTSLPDVLKDPSKVYRLNLNGRELTALPTDIEKLTNLQVLNVWNNRLTVIAPTLGALSNLQVLDVSGNAELNIASAISTFTNLKKLHNLNLWPGYCHICCLHSSQKTRIYGI